MRRLIWPVLFLFLLLLQGAGSVFYTGWLAFDLPLLGLYCYSLLRGQEHGAIMGAGIGFLQDAMTISVFGFHILSRTLLGFIIGKMKEKVFKENHSYHIAVIGLVCLGLRFCYWWLELIRNGGHWNVLGGFVWDSLGYCVGNMLMVVPMVFFIQFVYDWIKKEDISY